MVDDSLALLLPEPDGWSKNDRPGLWNKPLYAHSDTGSFFGWIRFDAMATTGVHQHLGPAYSFILQGALHDFQGSVEVGQMGINLSPATHEAIAYRPTLFVARLEAPVLYGDAPQSRTGALHTGGRAGPIVAQRPEDLPDLNITVADLPMVPTSMAGVGRRVIHVNREGGSEKRCVQLQMLPGTSLRPFRTLHRIDIFMLAGSAQLVQGDLPTGCLVSFEPGREVQLTSRFGALLFVWADGAVETDGDTPDPFGF